MSEDLLAKVVERIQSVRFNYTCEVDLQEGLAALLSVRDFTVSREFRLTAADRIDLFVALQVQPPPPAEILRPTGPGIGVEVKVQGAGSAIVRQLERYAAHPKILALVLVTNRASHDVPPSLNGKPVVVVRIGRVA